MLFWEPGGARRPYVDQSPSAPSASSHTNGNSHYPSLASPTHSLASPYHSHSSPYQSPASAYRSPPSPYRSPASLYHASPYPPGSDVRMAATDELLAGHPDGGVEGELRGALRPPLPLSSTSSESESGSDEPMDYMTSACRSPDSRRNSVDREVIMS